jgi:hypothetical protein
MSWLIYTLLGVGIITLLVCILYMLYPRKRIEEGMLDYFNIEDYLRTLPVTQARYVRIRPAASGGDGYMTISQIEVNDVNGNTISKGKPVTATSTATGSANVSVTVDGLATLRLGTSSVWTSGSANRATEYWQLDLGDIQQIGSIVYYGQVDASPDVLLRSRNMICELLDTNSSIVSTQTFLSADTTQRLVFRNAINIRPSTTGASIQILNPILMPLNSAQPEVFLVTGSYTKAQAQTTCGLLGGVVATQGQLLNAYNSGADWCSPGWTSDGPDAYYPIQSARTGCGTGPGIQTITADSLPNSDATNINCFGIKPKQDTSSGVQPFNTSGWTQYVGNTRPLFFGTSTVTVPDVQQLYNYVVPRWGSGSSYLRSPPAWIQARPDLSGSSIYDNLESGAPYNFLYEEGSTAVNTITAMNITIQLFGTVSAAAIAEMNASIELSKKIYLGSPDDVDKFINIKYTDLQPYIRANVGWQNFCASELVQVVSRATGDYQTQLVAANQTSNTSKCNTPFTADQLGLLPTPARDFIINWIYNRTQRIIRFKNPVTATFTEAQQKALLNSTTMMQPTINGSAPTLNVSNKQTLDKIAQSFYEAMGGNYIMSNIYDVFTIGGNILDIRFDLTKHAGVSTFQNKMAEIRMKYYAIRNSNVSQDILDSARENYQTSLMSLQTEQANSTLPPVEGVVGRFFYTYSSSTGSVDITGFTLDARAVTSFIPELNCGIQTTVGNSDGAINYEPRIVYTKNVPEPLVCSDPITLRRIMSDYVDLTQTDLASVILGTPNTDGETYTGVAGGPSMDVNAGSIRVNEIIGATQISPTQCAIKWKETLWDDSTNQTVSTTTTNVTRRALFSYSVNIEDWYASDTVFDMSGFTFYSSDTIPACVFNPTKYQEIVSPRLDSLNPGVTADLKTIRDDFIANTYNNGLGNPCPDILPTYMFSSADYCEANTDVNTSFNNSGKGPLNTAGAITHYKTAGSGIYANKPARASQNITAISPPIVITQPIPSNMILDTAYEACPTATCEDLNVLYSLVDQYNQDSTQPGYILRVTRAFTPNANQCDLEVDINYDTNVTDLNGNTVKKGSFTIDDAGTQVAVTSTLPTGMKKAETRAFTLHRELSDCSFVVDDVSGAGTGFSIQSNTPPLYKPMEYTTQFRELNGGLVTNSMDGIMSVVADAATAATSILSTYRNETVAAVGNIATLGSGCTAKCSDTAVINKMLEYYKSQNLHQKQIGTVLRVGTLNSSTCDMTFQEDTLAPGTTAGSYRVVSSQTAGLRFTMTPDSTPCSFSATSAAPILPAPPPSVSLNMSGKPSSATCNEVYGIYGAFYTQSTAAEKCASLGAVLATKAQLIAAHAAGADWCSPGFIADMSGTAMFPVTSSTQAGCGNGSAGVKTVVPTGGLAAANCYGMKPKSGQYVDVLAFAGSTWNQPNACASTNLNYVNPSKEAFRDYGKPVRVSESTFPLNRDSFGLDMARNGGGPPLETMFVEPLRFSTPADNVGPQVLGAEKPLPPGRATSYKYIRFRPTKTRFPMNPTVDVGKFRFLLGDNEIDMREVNVSNPMGSWVGDVDDVIGPGYKRGWSDVNKKAIVFAFPYATLVNGFTWTTANPDKGLGGDPVQWKLEGSQNGVYWTVLRDQTRHNYAVHEARFQELPVFRF